MVMNQTSSQRKTRSYSGLYMRQGKIGEHAFLEYFEQHKPHILVTDVRNSLPHRGQDIDFILKDGNKTLTVEVKTDTHLGKSPNILIELYRQNHNIHTPFYEGWFTRSGADWLVFYAPTENLFYWFNFHRLRKEYLKWLSTLTEQEINSRLRAIATDEVKTTFNLLLPASRFLKLAHVY